MREVRLEIGAIAAAHGIAERRAPTLAADTGLRGGARLAAFPAMFAVRVHVDAGAVALDPAGGATAFTVLAELVAPARVAATAAVSLVALEIHAPQTLAEVGSRGVRTHALALAARRREHTDVATRPAVIRIGIHVDAAGVVAKRGEGTVRAHALTVDAALRRRADAAALATVRRIRREIEAARVFAEARATIVWANAFAVVAGLASAAYVAAGPAVVRVVARRDAGAAVVWQVFGAAAALIVAALIGSAGVVASAAVGRVVVRHRDSVAHATVVDPTVAVIVLTVLAAFELVELSTGANIGVHRIGGDARPVVGCRATLVRTARHRADPARVVHAHTQEGLAILALCAALGETGVSARQSLLGRAFVTAGAAEREQECGHDGSSDPSGAFVEKPHPLLSATRPSYNSPRLASQCVFRGPRRSFLDRANGQRVSTERTARDNSVRFQYN
jgi:hypothetical protein